MASSPTAAAAASAAAAAAEALSSGAQIDGVFAPYMIHQLDVIKEQSESGLYVVKRVAAFLKKTASATKQSAQTTIKACQHEAAKERTRKDGMNLHVQAYLRIQDTILQQANTQSEFADLVLSDVVEPLNACFKEGEKRRLELVAKHQKLNHKLEAVTVNVIKSRNAAVKQWKELQSADQAMKKEVSKNSKKLPKLEKTFRGLQQKTVKAFQSFEQLLQTAIADQKRHWEVELPELIEDFERLEVGRMAILKNLLSTFAQLQTRLREPLEACIATAFEATGALAPRQELAAFVREQVQVHQLPPRVSPFKVLLPCSAAAVEAGDPEFYNALNQECEPAAQVRQDQLDAQDQTAINLPEPRELEIDGVVLLSGSVAGTGAAASADRKSSSSVPRRSVSSASRSAASAAGGEDSDLDSAGVAAELSQFLGGDSDSDDSSDLRRQASGSVSVSVSASASSPKSSAKKDKKEKKAKKEKKDKSEKSEKSKSGKSKKHRKAKSSGDENGAPASADSAADDAREAEEEQHASKAAAEVDPRPQQVESAEAEEKSEAAGGSKDGGGDSDGDADEEAGKDSPAEDSEDDAAEVFDIRAALKEDKKVPPMWLVVANFDFQPGDRPPDEEDSEPEDNEDLAFHKGDWLRVTHKQQHDSDEEDSEDEEARSGGGGQGADMWWRGYHCRLHGASERGIFPSNYVSPVTGIAADNPSLHVWIQRPSAMFAFAWAATKFGPKHCTSFVALWNDIEMFRKLECRHLRDTEEEIDRSNLVLQGHKIITEHLRPIAAANGSSKWQLKAAEPLVQAVADKGDAAIEPRMFDGLAKEMAQILSKGFEQVRKRHPEILVQLATVYSKASKA